MKFFTGPTDLKGWVGQVGDANSAADTINSTFLGPIEDLAQKEKINIEVREMCEKIIEPTSNGEDENAANVLFELFAKTKSKYILSDSSAKMKKEAQIMRQPGQYSMEERICPKLPFSVGKRIISTYNCRHYCLDSIVFDDDPHRVYCAEALWRRHVMDKFSSDWKDKDGNLVGGYIDEKFITYHDDGGNKMQLANGERTRSPRPHQYSVERRLEEARGEKTDDIKLAKKNINMIKISSSDQIFSNNSSVYNVFNDMLQMKESGMADEEILSKISDHYGISVVSAAKIQKMAYTKLETNNNKLYACSNSDIRKFAEVISFVAGDNVISTSSVEILKDNSESILPSNTHVVIEAVSPKYLFCVLDNKGHRLGSKFTLKNEADISSFKKIGNFQNAAKEVGLI